jgi:hypothetical protein
LREEHRVWLFENRAMKRIFGPKRDEVTGGWRKLHKDELHNLYSFPRTTRMIKSRKMIGHGMCQACGDEKCVYNSGWEA